MVQCKYFTSCTALFLIQWDPKQSQSLATFTDHEHVVYSAVWSPHIARTFASASGTNFFLFLYSDVSNVLIY